MNYAQIPTSVYPNYNYLAAENSFLKQSLEYKDAVIVEKQDTINKLTADVEQLSQANMMFKQERDKAVADAERWRVMKSIIRTQGNDEQVYTVQKVVDGDIEKKRKVS